MAAVATVANIPSAKELAKRRKEQAAFLSLEVLQVSTTFAG